MPGLDSYGSLFFASGRAPGGERGGLPRVFGALVLVESAWRRSFLDEPLPGPGRLAPSWLGSLFVVLFGFCFVMGKPRGMRGPQKEIASLEPGARGGSHRVSLLLGGLNSDEAQSTWPVGVI